MQLLVRNQGQAHPALVPGHHRLQNHHQNYLSGRCRLLHQSHMDRALQQAGSRSYAEKEVTLHVSTLALQHPTGSKAHACRASMNE